MDEQKIIDPIDRAILKKELNADRFMRITRKGENEIYCVNIHNSPNVTQEIGRLREATFRHAGGGTGKSVDLDDFDTDEICYDQLIVWSPEDEEIVGGYRFIECADALKDLPEQIHLSTAHYFRFSEKFIKDYL
ncbi:MAG: GNAT family N-acetyltransferase, partial [Crocinitomicaceae bacterium]|nr:GNAT family N-acetyltransferase [Crocinitomicaceae bacterium]